ncbi:uncharacterized protein MONOS_5365 [Monocercomonoides exilis]|uniref:uncharacterized protein n=1 Tax=Monocercomonoides exilis TaxID=2049356 RepID=UPI00355A8B0D|nr:hypothetical protein MONOS_5365 [Monocercomonoides exilis]|eukprot:MONOS_5365.1-p1 / transcript=MONOS_5365.1 / gene=MONOS_5365 / organism=Monocercomonoides_exilis_PA203 / gene_product=unspecified product / transcript_product=unspecified product / location=Mono_scaffold00155:46112-46644(-) / protein_length=156 / sequence_SO=supercontig / SO=protein_coding / is_pseudo=false
MGRGWGWMFGIGGALSHLNSNRQRETMDEFVAIGAVVPEESVPLIDLRNATCVIVRVCQAKGMIGVFIVIFLLLNIGGTLANCLLSLRASTDALHVRAPFSDSALSASALSQGYTCGAHESASPHQVVGMKRVYHQQTSGSARFYMDASTSFFSQ